MILSAAGACTLALNGKVQAQAMIAETDPQAAALVGISVMHFMSKPLLAMPLVASLSILGVFMLRCLQQPAAAVALIVVLGHVGYCLS